MKTSTEPAQSGLFALHIPHNEHERAPRANTSTPKKGMCLDKTIWEPSKKWKWSIHWTRVPFVVICLPSNGQVQKDVCLESHTACVGSIDGAECSWTCPGGPRSQVRLNQMQETTL